MLQLEIIRFNTLESTNVTAKLLIHENKVKEGAVIWADEQTKGRGYNSNSWESEKGKNLTFSIVLQPIFIEVKNQFVISKAISLGIMDFLKLYTTGVTVKWPNDIYIGDNKISGILIENSILNNRIEYCIAGIGLNINQKLFTSIAPNPCSLYQFTGFELNLNEALDLLLQSIVNRYLQLANAEFSLIDREYFSCLYRANELYNFESKGKHFSGAIIGIDSLGRLLIETEKKKILKFEFKEVSFC